MRHAARITSPNTREAGRRKRHAVLEWLGRWHVATVSQLAAVAHTSNRTFLYTMRKRKLLRVLQQDHVPGTVMMLTPMGKSLAGERVPEAAYYNTDISKVNHATLRHTIACQDVVLANWAAIDDATPERHLRVSGTAGEKRPDVLLHHPNGARSAIEVELTQKREDDIYRGFVAYLACLQDHAISQVVYAFRTIAMRDRYRRAFEAATWPLFDRSPQGRWQRRRDIRGREHRLQSSDVGPLLLRFRFELIDARIPTPQRNEKGIPNLGPCPTRPRIRITGADWREADPGSDPGGIVFVTPEQLFDPERINAHEWYQDEHGRPLAHVRTVRGRWRRIVLATETGHCEALTQEEFKALNLEKLVRH